MLLEMILYYFSISIVFVLCSFQTKREIPKPTRNEIGMLNSKQWCENKDYKVILQSLKQTSQFCDQRKNNHNFPQKGTDVVMDYVVDNQTHVKDILTNDSETSLEEDNLVAMFKRLKRLKHKRIAHRRKIQLKIKIDKNFKKYFPTSYHDQESKCKQEDDLNATLDYIEGFANYAAKSKNQVVIYSILQFYERLLSNNCFLPRSLFQKANILLFFSQLHKSFDKLNAVTETLVKIMAHPKISDDHYRIAAEKLVESFEIHNLYSNAILVQEKLVSKFSTDTNILNKLGRLYQKIRLNDEANSRAKQMYKKSLSIQSNDGYALFHLGYLMYIEETEKKQDGPKRIEILEKSVDLMKKGLGTKHQNILTQFNFCTLGYALNRLGKTEDAAKVFQDAVNLKLLSNFWQRSPNVINGIISKPFWTLEETNLSVPLEYVRKNWKMIRKEAIEIFNQNLYDKHEESLINKGKWNVYKLYRLGKRIENNCLNAPFTCKLVENIPHISDNRHGDVKFSLMESNTHIAAHSAPTNCRLRVHIGLDVPLQPTKEDQSKYQSRIRVTNQYKTWKNGEMIIFDDSFDHEVWHDDPKNHTRLIFIMDIWHPQLTETQIASL